MQAIDTCTMCEKRVGLVFIHPDSNDIVCQACLPRAETCRLCGDEVDDDVEVIKGEYYHSGCVDQHDCKASPDDGCSVCADRYSPERPLGGEIEPCDIAMEKELTK